MSLLTDSMEQCVMLDRTTVDDETGGFYSTWADGASFTAAIVLDSSVQARLAQVQGVQGLYTVTTPRNIRLKYNDVFRRTRDGKIFHVTSDGDDKKTPLMASIDMRQVSAEEWRSLPDE